LSDSQNGTVWVNGAIREWSDAAVPLMSDAVTRAASVFDGIIAEGFPDRGRLLAGRHHVRRLLRGAASVGMHVPSSEDEVIDACLKTAAAEAAASASRVIYVRPMIVAAALIGAHAGKESLTVAAFGQPDLGDPEPVRLQVSAWRRPPGDSLPAQVKLAANYQVSRLARRNAHGAGFDDALLLNHHGRIAEAAGAALLIDVDGQIVTPPPSEDSLPSITVKLLQRISRDLNIPFSMEPVSLATALAADGAALAGTLSDLPEVTSLNEIELPRSGVLKKLRSAYFEGRRGGRFADHLDYVRS
jgi:branched-chain amino acid aminotransferase